MNLRHLFLIAVFCLKTCFSLADSPLTSTSFWKVYEGSKVVGHVSEFGLDKKGLKMIGSKKTSSLDKFAAINSLGFAHKKVSLFEDYLLSKRKGLDKSVFEYLKTVSDEIPEESAQTQLLTSDDLMCWAYLQGMDDYFNPAKALRASFLAFMRDQENMVYGTVAGLISAQKAFDYDWCQVYKIGNSLIVEREYKNNLLDDEAVKIIMDYIGLYKQDCKN